eukprot:jgi/Galph1/3985/GphlegSOOS_G2670.1
MNKEYIWQARSKQRLPGCATPEESLDALYNQDLVCILGAWELLSEVLPLVPQGPSQWLAKLFQVTNKRFLFVCIDEIGFVGDEDFFQFKDLKSPSRGQSSSNVYRLFFRLLRPLLVEPFVLQEDAMPSRISLRFLRLDPFSSDIVNDIVQLSRYGEETLREIIFPKTPQGNDWLSEIVWDYTGGVPIYVHHVLTELAKMCVSNAKWRDLSVKDLKEKVETIHMIDSLFVHVDRMEPRVVGVFSSMLLAKLGSHSEYVLDIASHFGFYYTSDEASSTFTLVYPKIVLKYLETHYKQIPVLHSPVSRGWKFEILFSLVLYLKLCFCSKLGEMGIFQKTFVEDYLLVKVDGVQSRKSVPLPEYVASLSSRVATEVSAAGSTYHPNAWNLFYDTFLSKKDGIFMPSSQHSRGPDLIIRLSEIVSEETTTSSQMADSTQLVTFSSQKEPIVYLIGISLKCYHLDGPGFLIPVAQQVDLESKNIVAIQVIISTKYSIEVTRQFTDHQNWVLNSGTYENDNGHIYHQSLSSAPVSGSTNKWLRIPSRCQLVVCSTTSLQSFLGPEAYSQLEQVFRNEDAIQTDSKLIPLSSALTSWLQGMLRDEPKKTRGGFGMEMRSDANAMQVEYTREAQSAGASSSMDSSFDWKTFLRVYCGFTEQEVSYCLPKVSFIQKRDLDGITTDFLFNCGIDDSALRLRIMLGVRKVLGQ